MDTPFIHINMNEIEPGLRDAHDHQVDNEHMGLVFRHANLRQADRYKLLRDGAKPLGVHGDNLHLYGFESAGAFQEFDHSSELDAAKAKAVSQWSHALRVMFRAQYLFVSRIGAAAVETPKFVQLAGYVTNRDPSEVAGDAATLSRLESALARNGMRGATLYLLLQNVDNPNHPFAEKGAHFPSLVLISEFADLHDANAASEHPFGGADDMTLMLRSEFRLHAAWDRAPHGEAPRRVC